MTQPKIPPEDRLPSSLRNAWQTAAWLCLPVLAAVLVMLPRLIFPHFSLFDDARTLATLRQISQHVWAMDWETQAGRFTPVYWIFFSLPYALFGAQPFWFFLANTILFGLTAAAVAVAIRRLTDDRVQAAAGSLLYVLAGPVVENYYTISKSEPLQLAWLALSWLAWSYTFQARGWKRVVLFLLVGLAVLSANLTKEISLVLFPIAAAWLCLAWVFRKWRKVPTSLLPYLGYLLAAGLGCALAYLLRWMFLGQYLTGGSYTSNYVLELGRIASNTLHWLVWIGRDYAYLVPLLCLATYPLIRKRQAEAGLLLVNALVWALGWLVIYLPWVWVVEYYLLPFALGAAVAGGMALGHAFRFFREMDGRGRTWAWLLGLLSAILFLITLFNNGSNAAIQLAVDRADARAMSYVAENAPPGSTVLLNILYPNDYTEMFGPYLAEVLGRPDLQAGYLHPDQHPSGPVMVVAPNIVNQPAQTVRLGLVEATQDFWNSRLPNYFGQDLPPAWEMEDHFRLVMFDLPRLVCPLAPGSDYCKLTLPVFDLRPFRYGWSIYRTEFP
jgi:hypothetical protein